jgi:hypothetical protein
MGMRRSYLFFPYSYAVFLAPLLLDIATGLRALICGMCMVLALMIRREAFRNLGPILLASLSTLVPFLVVVQTAVCSSSGPSIQPPLFNCVQERSLTVLVKVGLGLSVLVLAAANEWRGSLVATVNGMWLPRDFRIMVIVGGVMIGEFRKAMVRVHHAFTARGDAVPALSWRNLSALPGMLSCVWASVLKASAERLNAQWSSQEFWARFVPAWQQEVTIFRPPRWSDLAIIVASGCTVVLVAWPV